MKFILSILCILCFCLSLSAQQNVTLLSHIDYVDQVDKGNDIWGYVAPDGTEYAIVGTESGTLIYSLEDPRNPIERILVPGVKSVWRDMRHFGEYVYVTADAGDEGFLVIDMTEAPENIKYIYRIPEVISSAGDTVQLLNCHNIHIDEFGFIYLAGCEGRGSDILDANMDPWNPPIVGAIEAPYLHDNFIQDNILYGSQIFQGEIAMYDVTDKSSPILLGSTSTTGVFTHNAWADPDNQYVFTTDEIPNGKIDAYDISNPQNIERIDVFQVNGTEGIATIPHNTHFLNDFLVTSWYTEGVVVIDSSEPDNLIQVAQYDTYLGPSGGGSGCWGVTPFLPSGIVLANDRNSGLYVLEVDYNRAARITGMVVNANTGEPIGNVEVSFLDGDHSDFDKSDAKGEFKTGQVSEGTFLLNFHHPFYNNKKVEVTIQRGQTTEVLVEMTQDLSTQHFKIIDKETRLPIKDAKIEVFKKGNVHELTTDQRGLATKSLLSDIYTIYAGKWGYINKEISEITLDDEGQTIIELEAGYADDFALDLGWESTWETTAEEFKGIWEREIPFGTGGVNKFNPAFDVESDIGEKAYITGNSEWASFGTNIVKEGSATLVSPVMNLNNYENPSIRVSLWMVRTITTEESNRIEIYYLQDGQEVFVYSHSNIQNVSEWSDPISLSIDDFINPNEDFQVVFKVIDDGMFTSLIEGGIDQFRVTGERIEFGTAQEGNLILYPNPATDEIQIYNETQNITRIEVLDITGKLLHVQEPDQSFITSISLDAFVSGNYLLKALFEDGTRTHKKFQVIRNN